MNRRHLIQALAMASGAFLFSAVSASAVECGNEEALRVGETLRYDRGLKVTFLGVRNDSRCPINARCTRPGDAEVILRVKASNQAARRITLHTNLQPQSVVIPAQLFPPGTAGIPKSYVISIGSLTPLPEAGKKTPQSAYRLKLEISVAQ